MPDNTFKNIMDSFVNAFNTADFPGMENTLAENLEAHITNAEGGVNLWEGRDNFMEGIRAFDLENIKPQLIITQTLDINPHQGMVMLEVKAERKGKKLHNHAAYLMHHHEGQITKLYMVEALPAYSDEFWNS